MTHQHNINNGIIRADGNVYIGDTIHYTIQQRFQDSHSVLFLRFEATSEGHYTARLSAKNAQIGTVDHYEQAVAVTIPPALFREVEAFQAMRRNIGGQVRTSISTALTAAPIHAEAALTNLLHQTFFGGDIGVAIGQFMTLLQQGKLTELLLVISTDNDALLQLPWEMVLPRLTTSLDMLPRDNFGLIRSHLTTLDAFNPQGSTERGAPLKLLFVTALPENMSENGKQLEIEKEQRLVIEAVQGLSGPQQPGLVIEILDCASLAEIKNALHKHSHDIVHISGHGTYLNDQSQGVLVMENDEGDQQIVTGQELGNVLRQFSSVKLLVLSACETAAGGVDGNLARQLAEVGLPAVLAMRFSVGDRAALLLAEKFYGRLAAGGTITKALYDVRNALWDDIQTCRRANPEADDAAEWFTPVLFQNQGIGSLIDKQRAYDAQTHRQFYPQLTFNRSEQTRLLIGENFIGRKRILVQLRQGFQKHEALCIYGMGGLGKTTTAEAFAHHYQLPQGGASDVLLFREGNYPIDELSILQRLVDRWKVRVRPDEMRVAEMDRLLANPNATVIDKLKGVIANCLREWSTALIFDNAEDVHDENGHFTSTDLRDFLRCLLTNTPKNCHILFTTRYKLDDLSDCLTQLHIGKMTYAEQYRYIQSSDQLSRLTTAQQQLLYQRFDGLPRAFEFLERLLIDQSDFNLDQLTQAESQAIESLLMSKLYDSLTEGEQDIFVNTSVFIGRTPIAALAYVLDKPEKELKHILATLEQKALCFGYSGSFEIHPLTKAWLHQQEYLSDNNVKDASYKAGLFFRRDPVYTNFDAATIYFEKAQAWDEYGGTGIIYADISKRMGFYYKAIYLCNNVIRKSTRNDCYVSASVTASLSYLSLGDSDEAIKILQEALNTRIVLF